jgi:polyhydroxybutyrate depolymerase
MLQKRLWQVGFVAVLLAFVRPVTAGSIFIDIGRGPVEVIVPSSYDGKTPVPLVFLLHGYQETAADVENYLQFAPMAEEFGFLLALPQGESDFLGLPYWNATPACCDIFGENPDDSTYLRTLVDQIMLQLMVDDRRIYFTGYSAGGFMSYRMACDHADIVAAVASLAGATYINANDCVPSEPVSVLEIHGTSDLVISYSGGCLPLLGCYPGAMTTVEFWAEYGGCDIVTMPTPPPIDLVTNVSGAETSILRYALNCQPGGSSELWTMNSTGHFPNLSPDYSRQVVEFLLNHPKPELCPADLDGDDAVGTTDLLALLAAWGSRPEGPPDFDGGGVGITDLLVLLSGWGGCE